MNARKELTGCSEGFSLAQKIDDDCSSILAFGTCASFASLVENYSRYKEDISVLVKNLIQ
jgi:hypothetical protein